MTSPSANRSARSSRVAITGASGYLGSRLTQAFDRAGIPTLRLSRTASVTESSFPFELDKGLARDDLASRQVSALVHAGYDFRLIHWKDIQRVNVKGSIQLFETALQADVRKLVFISSMAAHDHCRSLYGRAKLEVERFVLANGGLVVRPGLIYGASAGGIVGRMRSTLLRSRWVPLIGGGHYALHLVHEEDLCKLTLRLVTEPVACKGPILAASEQALTFREFLVTYAEYLHVRPRFVAVPWRLVWLALVSLELAGLRPGFRSDSVVNLAHRNPAPDFTHARAIGATFREFDFARAASEPPSG